jgi:hypothetical protein
MEVRRVTTVSTQKASKPECSSRSGALSKVFTGVKSLTGWAFRSSHWLLLPDQGEASPTRPATSFRHQIPARIRGEAGQGLRDTMAAITGGNRRRLSSHHQSRAHHVGWRLDICLIQGQSLLDPYQCICPSRYCRDCDAPCGGANREADRAPTLGHRDYVNG